MTYLTTGERTELCDIPDDRRENAPDDRRENGAT